jgi:ATP-binding cassette subfamily B protein
MSALKKAKSESLGSVLRIVKDIGVILSFLSSRRKIQLFILLFLQIIGGFLEVLSLGALLPFISAISNAASLIKKTEIQPIIEFLNIENETELILYASIIFAAAFTFVNLFKIFIFWLQNRMTVAVGCDISQRFFYKILHQNFEYHLNVNSGALISRIFIDLGAVLHFIAGAMMISTQFIAIFAIVTAVVYYDAFAAVTIFSTTLILYFAIANINKSQMVKNGYVISDSRVETIHNLQIALGGIRDVILGNKQKKLLEQYAIPDRAFRKASRNTQFLSFLPRYLIEIAGVIILISAAAYYAISEGGLFGALPLIGALAMAIVRILPAAQTAYNSYSAMQSVHISIERSLEILGLETQVIEYNSEKDIPAPRKSIDLIDIWFRFSGVGKKAMPSEWILKGINISIPANKTVAFVGKTGSGKTTLSDIILGLLLPDKGALRVDNTDITMQNLANWRQCVTSVPQSIFLIDASVKENVAFGEPIEKIDLEKVKKACALAQIDKLIERRPGKYDEIIGENGLRLSGGQRQRLGIARALYKESCVLVLDEATSALDNKTEATVMETISKLHGHQTIVVIAHRLETIKNADLIFEIQDGKVVAQGSYEELLENSKSFREMALRKNNGTQL